jgi:cytochrome c
MRSNSVSLFAATLLLFAVVLLAGCDNNPTGTTLNFPGDPKRGKTLITEYGCGNCHLIPKVAGADGNVGPPLLRLANRVYIAGYLRNSPENMSAWLQDPQRILPGNAMPRWAYRPKTRTTSLRFFTRSNERACSRASKQIGPLPERMIVKSSNAEGLLLIDFGNRLDATVFRDGKRDPIAGMHRVQR